MTRRTRFWAFMQPNGELMMRFDELVAYSSRGYAETKLNMARGRFPQFEPETRVVEIQVTVLEPDDKGPKTNQEDA